MSDQLISRNALIQHAYSAVVDGVEKDIIDLSDVDYAPTVEERPQGKWMKWNFKDLGAFCDWEYKCSNCEKVYGGEHNFCPNCGAEMQKGGAV